MSGRPPLLTPERLLLHLESLTEEERAALTSQQLQRPLGVSYWTIWRRLAQLESKGLVRVQVRTAGRAPVGLKLDLL